MVRGGDGDRASDNQSIEGTGLGHGLASLARVGPLVFRDERRGESGSILFDI